MATATATVYILCELQLFQELWTVVGSSDWFEGVLLTRLDHIMLSREVCMEMRGRQWLDMILSLSWFRQEP